MVEKHPSEFAETLGDVAVPVGHSLKVWQEPSGPLVEFELVRIEAQSGEPALARFIAKRGGAGSP